MRTITDEEGQKIVQNLIAHTTSEKLKWKPFSPETQVEPDLCRRTESAWMMYIFCCWNHDMSLIVTAMDDGTYLSLQHENLRELRDAINDLEETKRNHKVEQMIETMLDPVLPDDAMAALPPWSDGEDDGL